VPVLEHVHLGLLLSVLDLGAITTFRTGAEPGGNLEGASDTTQPVRADEAPQVGIGQVFSPGIYATLAPWQASPLVIGVGASLSPRLRQVAQAGVSRDVDVVRVGAFVAVDIPILPLD
jgi:hypothetical protein